MSEEKKLDEFELSDDMQNQVVGGYMLDHEYDIIAKAIKNCHKGDETKEQAFDELRKVKDKNGDEVVRLYEVKKIFEDKFGITW